MLSKQKQMFVQNIFNRLLSLLLNWKCKQFVSSKQNKTNKLKWLKQSKRKCKHSRNCQLKSMCKPIKVSSMMQTHKQSLNNIHLFKCKLTRILFLKVELYSKKKSFKQCSRQIKKFKYIWTYKVVTAKLKKRIHVRLKLKLKIASSKWTSKQKKRKKLLQLNINQLMCKQTKF